jgi:hypothetical protein
MDIRWRKTQGKAAVWRGKSKDFTPEAIQETYREMKLSDTNWTLENVRRMYLESAVDNGRSRS